MRPTLVSVREAALALDVSVTTIYRMLSDRVLPSVMIRGVRRIPIKAYRRVHITHPLEHRIATDHLASIIKDGAPMKKPYNNRVRPHRKKREKTLLPTEIDITNLDK